MTFENFSKIFQENDQIKIKERKKNSIFFNETFSVFALNIYEKEINLNNRTSLIFLESFGCIR